MKACGFQCICRGLIVNKTTYAYKQIQLMNTRVEYVYLKVKVIIF